jgi:uncharacterized membrane-anchored protein
MKVNPASRILAVAALCALGLIGLVISEATARAGGQEVVLPMAAVDPRALLGGHYVMIDLRDRLPASRTCPEQRDDWDWLALSPNGATYTLSGSAASRDEAQQIGSVLVKGSFNCNPPSPPEGSTPGQAGVVTLNLGIERFYINQAEAERIGGVLSQQQANEETRVFAIVSVGRDGRARLKGLLVDGHRLDLTLL